MIHHNIPPHLLKEIIDGLESGDIVIQRTEVNYMHWNDHSYRTGTGASLGQPYARRFLLELIDTRPPPAIPPQPQTPPLPDLQAAARKVQLESVAKMLADPPPIKDLGVLNEYWVGYRDFKTDLKDGLLQSRNGHVWPAYEPLVAKCTSAGVSHDPPVEKCGCGIYAYDTPDHKDLKAEGGIWGEVALYGDAYRCESGFRAELAYPLSLFMKDHGTKAVRRLKAHLEETYGVPVFLVNQRDGQTTADLITEYVRAVERVETKHGKIFDIFGKPFGP